MSGPPDKPNGENDALTPPESAIPDPDTAPTGDESVRAQAFAARIDALIAGSPAPPAMPAEERALLEIAASMRAGVGVGIAELSPDQVTSIIDTALAAPAGRPNLVERVSTDANAIDSRFARKLQRRAPWLVAVVSAAAAAAAILSVPAQRLPTAQGIDPLAQHTPSPPPAAFVRSRPSDALIGAIPATDAEQASERIDAIFGDRMMGYRSLRLSPRSPSSSRGAL